MKANLGNLGTAAWEWLWDFRAFITHSGFEAWTPGRFCLSEEAEDPAFSLCTPLPTLNRASRFTDFKLFHDAEAYQLTALHRGSSHLIAHGAVGRSSQTPSRLEGWPRIKAARWRPKTGTGCSPRAGGKPGTPARQIPAAPAAPRLT